MSERDKNKYTNTSPTSRGRKVFDQKKGLVIIRAVFFLLRILPDKYLARLALRVFLTPARNKISEKDAALFASAESETLTLSGRDTVVYRFGNGASRVLMCHAWGGRASNFSHLIPPLLALDFSIYTFDAPAHGASPGKTTDMVEYVSIIHALKKRYGPFDLAIGHSFGAGNLLWATKSYDLSLNSLVLIGCFSHGEWIIDAFADALRLSGNVRAIMKSLLEEKYPQKLVWKNLSMAEMVKTAADNIMLLHDRDDQTIPYWHATTLSQANPQAKLISTTGLGHVRILKNDQAVDDVMDFIKQHH